MRRAALMDQPGHQHQSAGPGLRPPVWWNGCQTAIGQAARCVSGRRREELDLSVGNGDKDITIAGKRPASVTEHEVVHDQQIAALEQHVDFQTAKNVIDVHGI